MTFREVPEPIYKKGEQKAKIVQQKLQEMQKWHHVLFTEAGKAQCVNWTAEIMDVQVFHKSFEWSIESQHQRTVPLVDGTRITNAGVAIRTRAKMDVHRSLMKRKKL